MKGFHCQKNNDFKQSHRHIRQSAEEAGGDQPQSRTIIHTAASYLQKIILIFQCSLLLLKSVGSTFSLSIFGRNVITQLLFEI